MGGAAWKPKPGAASWGKFWAGPLTYGCSLGGDRRGLLSDRHTHARGHLCLGETHFTPVPPASARGLRSALGWGCEVGARAQREMWTI